MKERAWLTTTLIASAVAVFALQCLAWYGYHSSVIDTRFALSPQTLRSDCWWQLVTYAWLHSETLIIHILFNMLMLSFLGRELERIIGPWRLGFLYLGGVIAAALTWLAFHPPGDDLIVGASGAVFALLTSYACYTPRNVLQVWVFFILPIRMTAGILAFLLVAFEALCQWRGWLPFIAHTAHLGGAAFGYVTMLGWKWQTRHRSPSQEPT